MIDNPNAIPFIFAAVTFDILFCRLETKRKQEIFHFGLPIIYLLIRIVKRKD
jgi:hypothetical protein